VNGHKWTPEEIERLQRTSKSGGFMNRATLVTRWVNKLGYKGLKILDFGSGIPPRQTRILREQDLNVTPYDFGYPSPIAKHYDIVMVSNVLNVHKNLKAIKATIQQVIEALRGPSSFALINYPSSPRYISEMSSERLQQLLNTYFTEVQRLPGPGLVWKCHL